MRRLVGTQTPEQSQRTSQVQRSPPYPASLPPATLASPAVVFISSNISWQLDIVYGAYMCDSWPSRCAGSLTQGLCPQRSG